MPAPRHAISGESYYDYVRAHVHEPAGMTATGSAPESEVVANRAVGYTRLQGALPAFANAGWQPNTDTLPYRGTAAGGGSSTVEDLLRLANALENHTLLNAHYTDLLLTPKVDFGRGKYAYGFGHRTVAGVTSVGHNGGAPGMNGELRMYQDSGYVIVVLANLDPPAAESVASLVANRLPK